MLESDWYLEQAETTKTRLETIIDVHDVGPSETIVERPTRSYHFTSNQNSSEGDPIDGAHLAKRCCRDAFWRCICAFLYQTVHMPDLSLAKRAASALHSPWFVRFGSWIKQIARKHTRMRKFVSVLE